MTILSIAHEVMDELGLARPSILMSASDPNGGRIAAAVNRTGQALLKAHDWSVLHREHELTTQATVDNYAVPDDWSHALANVAWDRTTYWRLRGNLTPGQWQRRRSGLVASPAMRFGYRLVVGPLAGSVLIDPTPTAAHDLLIEYVSRFWCESADGDGQARLQADTDEVRLDHELFTLGLTWRVKRAYGMPYADERADYEVALKTAIGNDLNMPVVQMGRQPPLPYPNIAEGSWGA
jgi:hypothetical protein